MLVAVANEVRVGTVAVQGLWNLDEIPGEPLVQESSMSELGFVETL